MGGRLERYLIPALVGLAPVLLLLLTWAPNGLSPVQHMIRVTALPVLGAEFFAIAVAFAEGLARSWRDLMPPRYAMCALGILIVIAFATAFLVAPDRVGAISRTILWLVHLMFGFAIAFLCTRQVRTRDVSTAYLIGFVLFAGLFAVFVATAWDRPIDWVRDLPAAEHIRHIAIYSAAMTGLSVGLLASATKRWEWIAAFLITTVGFGIGLWTGSRGMVLSVAVALIAGLGFIPALRRVRVWGGATVALVLAIAAVARLPVPQGNMMGLERTVAATTGNEVTTGRVEMWRGVVRAIEHQPLLGYGEGQMREVAPFYDMMQPHDIVLQVLLAWGFAGLLCILVLSYTFAARALPAVRDHQERLAPPFLAMLAILALSFIDAALFHVLPTSIFAACMGMIASAWIRNPSAP